jgi:hypothetical protein
LITGCRSILTPRIDMPLFITPIATAPIIAPHHLAHTARGRRAADEAGGDHVALAAEPGLLRHGFYHIKEVATSLFV